MPAQNPGAARRLAAYAAPYRYRLAGAVFFMLASSGLNILPPWLFKSVVDDVLISKNLFALNLICVSVILIFVLKAMSRAWSSRYSTLWKPSLHIRDIVSALDRS